MTTSSELIKLAREEERERIAKMVDDFSWVMPMFKSKRDNEVSDDAAELVKEQIATAIRANRL